MPATIENRRPAKTPDDGRWKHEKHTQRAILALSAARLLWDWVKTIMGI